MSADLSRFSNFRPPGPAAGAFLQDRTTKVRALLGPVGGGKTVTTIYDHLTNAAHMPTCNDGRIRFRVALIGTTYGQLERNLYPTWWRWLPPDGGDWTVAEFKGGGGRFATHRIEFDTVRSGRKIRVHFEAIFAAIGENAVEQFMRGFEPTAFQLYEMDLLPEGVLDQALTRLGRYPPTGDAPDAVPKSTPPRAYITGDLNAPDIDSWFYHRFEENADPAYMRVYKQPSGRGPKAENLTNLADGYYETQVAILSSKKGGKNLIKRYVDAQYGPSQDGEPVFDQYSDELHYAAGVISPAKAVPLLIGLDQGVQQPAAVIGQRVNGQLRCLAELLPGRMGPKGFARELKALIGRVAPGLPIGGAWSDPAGFAGADHENDNYAWTEIVAQELGVPIQPAGTNEIALRLQAVVDELTYMIDGNTPALVISRACPQLRKGMASHYRYAKRPGTNSVPDNAKPEKNLWANLQDALQYLLLGEKGRYGVIAQPSGGRAGANARPGAARNVTMKTNINLFGS